MTFVVEGSLVACPFAHTVMVVVQIKTDYHHLRPILRVVVHKNADYPHLSHFVQKCALPKCPTRRTEAIDGAHWSLNGVPPKSWTDY